MLRGYEQSLRARLLPALGGAKLGDIRRSDVQRLVNRMMADGVGASTVRNSLLPLRAIYRQALALDEVRSTRPPASSCPRSAVSASGSQRPPRPRN